VSPNRYTIVPWKEAKLSVPTQPMKWPANRRERVSVNSFGIGGSNAHVRNFPYFVAPRLTFQVIMESAASFGIHQGSNGTAAEVPRLSLLFLSAKSEVSLKGSIEKHSEYVRQHGSSRLRDLAYTLATRRHQFENRTFCVSDGDEPLQAQTPVRAKNTPKSLVFVFTGQGAQWPEMGKQLIDDFPSFKADIEEMDSMLSQCHTPPSWKILGRIKISKRGISLTSRF
jgi:acyl transferase domain-containing protein